MDVICVCTTGAQAMHYADTVDDGNRGRGYRMKDMMLIHSFVIFTRVHLKCFW